jgi:hypothetical protein
MTSSGCLKLIEPILLLLYNDLIEKSDEILLMKKFFYKHKNLKIQQGHLNKSSI